MRLLLSFERDGGIGRRAGLIILWLPGYPGGREGSNPFYAPYQLFSVCFCFALHFWVIKPPVVWIVNMRYAIL